MTARGLDARCTIAPVLLAVLLLIPLGVLLSSSRQAQAQTQRWDCSSGSCRLVPATGVAPPYTPPNLGTTPFQSDELPGGLLPGLSGGQCAGGTCVPGQLQPGLSPLETLPGFRPGQSFLQQPFSFLTELFRAPAFLASAIIPSIAQQLTRSLFTYGAPRLDITHVDPADPRGGGQRIRVSPGARRGQPELKPGDFRVENLEQRGLVEEGTVPERINPTEVGPGQRCPGGVCPASPPAGGTTPPGGTVPPVGPGPGSCPGGVCPGR